MADVLAGNSINTPPTTVLSTVPITPATTDVSTAPPTPIATPGALPTDPLAGDAGRTGLSSPFYQQMAQAADKLGIPANQPGGWAKSLLASAQKALAGNASNNPGPFTGLGDIGKVPSGGGALYGIGKVMDARAAAQRQAQSDDILHAYTTAQTVALQRAVSREDEEEADKHQEATDKHNNINVENNKNGKIMADAFSQTHAPVGHMIPEDELTANAGPGQKYDHFQNSAFPVGTEIQVRNGKEVPVTVYDVFNRSEDQIPVDDTTAAFLKKHLPEGEAPTPGTLLDHGDLDHLGTRAMSAATFDNLIKAQNDKEDIEMTGKQNAADKAAVIPLIGAHPDDIITALQAGAKQVGKDGKPTPVAQSASRLLSAYDPKDLETHRHNVADEAAKKAEDAEKVRKDALDAKAAQDALNGQLVPMTPEEAAKISQLPKPQQDLLSKFPAPIQGALYEGAFGHDDPYRIFATRLTKGGEGMTMATALGIMHELNPLFDPSKAPAYQKTRNVFESAKIADNITHLNTSFDHLKDVEDATNKISSTPGLSSVSSFFGAKSPTELNTALTNASEEIANAYSEGKAGKDEIAHHRNDLIGNSAPEQRNKTRAAVNDLIDKANELQDQWKRGSVPGSTPPQPILSPKALKNISTIDPTLINKIDPDLLRNAGVEPPSAPQPQQPTQPQTAVSLAAARQLPAMKGLTDDQITAAIKAQGHQVAQ